MLYSNDPDVTIDSLRLSYQCPTIEDLQKAKANKRTGEIPEGVGNRWTPIHHATLIEQILGAADGLGLSPAALRFELSKDTHDLFGVIEFDGVPGFSDDPILGGRPLLGFRHSNLQRFRLIGVTGESMFICSNGLISGIFVFGMKQSKGNVERGMGIEEGMQTWLRQTRLHRDLMDKLNGAGINDRQADHLLVQAAREDIVPPSQILKVDAAYRAYTQPENPHHEGFHARTAGNLVQAVSEVAKLWRRQRVETALSRFPYMAAAELGIEVVDAREAVLDAA
jgi:hypothetical protein